MHVVLPIVLSCYSSNKQSMESGSKGGMGFQGLWNEKKMEWPRESLSNNCKQPSPLRSSFSTPFISNHKNTKRSKFGQNNKERMRGDKGEACRCMPSFPSSSLATRPKSIAEMLKDRAKSRPSLIETVDYFRGSGRSFCTRQQGSVDLLQGRSTDSVPLFQFFANCILAWP